MKGNQALVHGPAAVEVYSAAEILPQERINHEHELARQCVDTAIEHAARCGELLIEQKAELQHGQFKAWVDANCAFSYESARNYMRAFKEIQKGNALPFSSLRQALGYGDERKKNDFAGQCAEDFDGCQVADLDALPQKFGCIYADPPWLYGNQATRAATGNHYGGMSIDEICDMPIDRLAADNAHLHLWTTNGFLPDAFDVIRAWGFQYKSCFVWTKPQMGIGNYWRVSHEFLLLGVRGSCPFADKSLMSWATIGRTKHSAKPDQIRQMIERASPGPRLELFARRLAPGWVSWGDEIERAIFDKAVGE